MLIDLNIDQVLERGAKAYNHSMRRLICKNLTSVENYNNLVLELLKSNKMPQKLSELERSLALTNSDL